MSADTVIFITGTGRSGTNILKRILSQHSDIATLPFEYRFTVDPRGVFDFYNTFPSYWTPYWADAKIKDLEHFLLSLAEKVVESSNFAPNVTPTPYEGWELNRWIPGYEQMVQDFIESMYAFKYAARWPGTKSGIENNQMYFTSRQSKNSLAPAIRAFLANCFNSICKAQGKPILVEDNTHSILFATAISETVPNGRMIHMVRDPRDVVASLIKQRWAPSELDQCIRWYNEVLESWQLERSSLSRDFYIEVKFEDLIQDSSEIMQQIAQFSQFPFQEKLLDVDLSKHNIGRYKEQFSQKEIDKLNQELFKWIDHYNYE